MDKLQTFHLRVRVVGITEGSDIYEPLQKAQVAKDQGEVLFLEWQMMRAFVTGSPVGIKLKSMAAKAQSSLSSEQQKLVAPCIWSWMSSKASNR